MAEKGCLEIGTLWQRHGALEQIWQDYVRTAGHACGTELLSAELHRSPQVSDNIRTLRQGRLDRRQRCTGVADNPEQAGGEMVERRKLPEAHRRAAQSADREEPLARVCA